MEKIATKWRKHLAVGVSPQLETHQVSPATEWRQQFQRRCCRHFVAGIHGFRDGHLQFATVGSRPQLGVVATSGYRFSFRLNPPKNRAKTRRLSKLCGKQGSAVLGCVTQHFFDAKQLVVLGHAVASAC